MLIRAIRRYRPGSELWPLALVLIVLLVPAACLLWFMAAAMRNERLAARQKMAELYRAQLSNTRSHLQQHWSETAAAVARLTTQTSAPAAFAQCVQSGLVDAVVLFDETGLVRYPNAPVPVPSDFGEQGRKWQEASRLEYLRQHAEAARRYAALGQDITNRHTAARAFQAAARCLVQAGTPEAAIQLIHETFGNQFYENAADPQGRLIAANAELLALELSTDRSGPVAQSIARRLSARLTDYQNPALAATQRRFLMREMVRLAIVPVPFPTLAAEELAAAAADTYPQQTPSLLLQRSPVANLWQFTTADQRVLALVRSERLGSNITAVIANGPTLADTHVTLVAPDREAADAFVTLPAGESMPGWRLALAFKDRQFFETTAGRRTAVYLWTALAVVVGMGLLTAMAWRLLRRQMALARLKNDLAATVSHELKTPLASMRVLVETLLDAPALDEPRTREYLQLIAHENQRLCRLIQNFLTFSRLERKRYAFHFTPVTAQQIVTAVLASARGRFETPGCRLDVQIDDGLPPLRADADALSAALLNLLENAYKYSEDIKDIVLRARAEKGAVVFSVTDNGIGITPRERRRIFQPFYQIDQRLSRKGSGCGLGLSIVQFITAAHHGSLSVESQPGRGSTFTISLPAAADLPEIPKEAIA